MRAAWPAVMQGRWQHVALAVSSARRSQQQALSATLSDAVHTADVGFGVGHTRETETKGIWVWGEPKKVNDGNGKRMVRWFKAAVD